ncbi:MAG: hypothetical protein KDI49_18410 [Gammaproteobacteria bacterium]|nr:hypothetical protein [Gammaproteobacteria bacterium]
METLIEIAILEKRPDDVVDLYQRFCETKRWGWEIDKTVAQTLANSHPDLALAIWNNIVSSLIDQVKPKAYEEAAVYLRLMNKIYTRNHRLEDWRRLLEELRIKHKASGDSSECSIPYRKGNSLTDQPAQQKSVNMASFIVSNQLSKPLL